MMPDPKDVEALIRDKYHGDKAADMIEDLSRLAREEPLAYVIGWVPFLNLKIYLDSKPLIPRPETEWWTEQLITHLRERFGEKPFTLLDLCAGSGAIGLSILSAFPAARVSFGELEEQHAALIQKNIEENGLDPARADIRTGDLFAPFEGEQFDVIATNPPYIPEGRELPESVSKYEPSVALFAGQDGLAIVERIAKEAPKHLNPQGELWMECDIDNIEAAKALIGGEIHTDPYGRPRLLVQHY